MSEVERELSYRRPRPPIALQGRGHGPVWVLRVLEDGTHHAECVQCGWTGPDRSTVPLPQAVLMTEDDAVHHLHAVGSNCGQCEACLIDGAIRVAERHREVEIRADEDCPACGRKGLFIGAGGYLTCSQVDCPQPDVFAYYAALLARAADVEVSDVLALFEKEVSE